MNREHDNNTHATIGPVDTEFDALIRSLDPAHVETDTAHEAERDALLTRILTTPREDAEHAGDHTPRTRATAFTGGLMRRRSRRRAAWWLAPVAAAAALGTAFALNVTSGQQPAYASWTAEPTPVTGELLTTVETACRDSLAESLARLSDVPEAERPTTDPATARTVVAEQRGTYLFTSLVTSDGSTQNCLSDVRNPTRVDSAGGAMATGSVAAPKELTQRQVESSGAGSSSGPEGTIFMTTGRVAPGTKKVTLQVEGGPTVTASVRDGYFVAWWPDPSLTTTDGAQPNGLPLMDIQLVTADGTVVTNPEMVGYAPVTPEPEQIANVSMGGGVSDDGGAAGTVVTVEGYAGEKVSSVTVHLDGHTVTTPAQRGQFRVEIPSDVPEAKGTPTFDLTLTDGTVLTQQIPRENPNR